MLRTAMSILWPSFLAAGMAEAAFFTLFDLLLFWMFAAISSALTSLLQRSSEEINRCPLDSRSRPAGCPKRAER